MTKPLNTEIAPHDSVTFTYNPGVPVYQLVLQNGNAKACAASVSYDRASGTLMVTVVEKGV